MCQAGDLCQGYRRLVERGTSWLNPCVRMSQLCDTSTAQSYLHQCQRQNHLQTLRWDFRGDWASAVRQWEGDKLRGADHSERQAAHLNLNWARGLAGVAAGCQKRAVGFDLVLKWQAPA